MTFSDALPVQFWLNGQETFNQKIVDGVHHFCFCQPFECDDEIRIQFTDSEQHEFKLKLIDSDGNVAHIFDFDKNDELYSLSFIPSNYSPDLCDTNLKLQIVQEGEFQNADFDDGLTGWTLIEQNNWSSITASSYAGNSAALFNITLDIVGGSGTTNRYTDWMRQSIGQNSNGTIDFNYSIRSGTRNVSVGLWAPGNFFIVFYKNGVSVSQETILTNLQPNTSYSGTYTSTETDFDTFALFFDAYFTHVGGVMNGTWDFYVLEFAPVGDGFNEEIVAESDCIKIASTYNETILITYSNHRNFADLENLDVSPDPEYQIRIPAVFFEERFPEEQEIIELSNSTSVQAFAQIKAQKLLRIGQMPFYMHRKLKLILAHQFVSVDGTDYVKQEPYDIIEGNKRYPLRQATCWLTEKNYIKRNIL